MPEASWSGTYTQAWVVTPSDVLDIGAAGGPKDSTAAHTSSCRAFLAVAGGAVTATLSGDRGNGPVTFPVLEGMVYPMALTQVFTSTTATLLALR